MLSSLKPWEDPLPKDESLSRLLLTFGMPEVKWEDPRFGYDYVDSASIDALIRSLAKKREVFRWIDVKPLDAEESLAYIRAYPWDRDKARSAIYGVVTRRKLDWIEINPLGAKEPLGNIQACRWYPEPGVMTVEFRKWNSKEAEEYTVAEFREYLGRKNIARIRAESACTEIGDTGSELCEGIGYMLSDILSIPGMLAQLGRRLCGRR